MPSYLTRSLTAQIRDAERQVLIRQHKVGIRTATLARKIHQQLTAPATLLLAGGIGFVIGELTKCQTPEFHGTVDKPHTTEATPLRIVLNLITSARTLYTALPLVWMIKSYCQPGASDKASALQPHPMTAPDATGSLQRSMRNTVDLNRSY